MGLGIDLKEILIILLASIVLGLSLSFLQTSILVSSMISFLVILSFNILFKKIAAYYFEADTKVKFWEWFQYGFRRDYHFSRPVPMLWLPLMISFFTRGFFLWMPIVEFDVAPKVERVAKRHGLYRYTEMTDWHIALIATAGLIINLVLAIIGYLSGFEMFAKLNIYFALWSLLPLSSLDGSKILFGSRVLWFSLLVITSIFWGYSMFVI